MQEMEHTSDKDCLKNRYIDANLATQIVLERNRLWFLQNCTSFKRPPQSLRVRGLNGLTEGKWKLFVQEVEARALQCAINEKKKLINILEEQLSKDNSDKLVDQGLIILNKKKLDKKLAFYAECDENKWKEWGRNTVIASRTDCVALSRKLKRKIRSVRRKLHKKETALVNAAHYALNNNLVMNLTDIEVPLFSIAVLSYGPGWIPTPTLNLNQLKVDALNAANKQVWSAMFKDANNNSDKIVPLSLLKNDITSSAPLCDDPVVNQSKDTIKNFASNVNPAKCKNKLNKFEREGLQWLKHAVRTRKIAITQADKGGCILIVPPDLIVSSTLEKLNDTSRYEVLGASNPLPNLRKELITLWKYAVHKDFVTPIQAEKTVGLLYKPDPRKTNPFTLSTADKFKPGIPYPYPLYKIHKLTLAQLNEPGVRPPVRLVTDLHDGVTARSDKFLVWKWLVPLCDDYACDLVKDSTSALLKLIEIEDKRILSNSTLAFGIDVVSLYDSLKFNVVALALRDAMGSCRPDWDSDFCDWLVDMCIFSFESAVVNFRGVWYGVKEGVPTGGIPSVSIANICVYFVFKKLIYTQENNLVDMLRFVDDGLGFFDGTSECFHTWFNSIREKSVELYGLDLTVVVNPVTVFTQFLDINLKFIDGKLTTDIFRKETDANRYLSFHSHHPRHMFRSVVYSQGMRYRRIINDDKILKLRLNELKTYFINSGFPGNFVCSILDSILLKPHSLEYVTRDDKDFITPWVVTYGPGFDETKKVAKTVNEMLTMSETWRDKEVKNIIQVVARRAPNLKDLLFKRKALALYDSERSGTLPCDSSGNCQTCTLTSNTIFLHHNTKIIKTSGGDCKSWNLIYCFQCKLCNILYVGKTTDPLHKRVNGHRHKFYDVLRHGMTPNDFYDDEQIVGAHLVHQHGLKNKKDFNCSYRLFILAFSNPVSIRKTEQFWIDKLNTRTPYGLNQNSSVGDS